jgi:hypothetical protein
LGTLVAVPLRPALTRSLSLVYPKERFRSQVVLSFVEFARNKLAGAVCLMPRPIEARIDLAALRHNYLVAREYASRRHREAKAWAVVKANAYGHGLLRAAAALGDVADGFALLDLDEAIALRRRAFGSRFSCSKVSSRPPIWYLRDACLESVVVHSLEQLRNAAAGGLGCAGPAPADLSEAQQRYESPGDLRRAAAGRAARA